MRRQGVAPAGAAHAVGTPFVHACARPWIRSAIHPSRRRDSTREAGRTALERRTGRVHPRDSLTVRGGHPRGHQGAPTEQPPPARAPVGLISVCGREGRSRTRRNTPCGGPHAAGREGRGGAPPPLLGLLGRRHLNSYVRDSCEASPAFAGGASRARIAGGTNAQRGQVGFGQAAETAQLGTTSAGARYVLTGARLGSLILERRS
jgi:hypothetical protein